MDAIAAAAGVGKGTLFRRFGDKAGLAVALLDTAEHKLQEEILSGPAPLGQRLSAFIHAVRPHSAYLITTLLRTVVIRYAIDYAGQA